MTFFRPRGVVVVGASASAEKLGYGAARNLVYSGYNGAIHFVSQKDGELFNRPVYTDLAQVPDPVDLAVLVVPAHATPDMLEACGKRGILAAIVVASGFREAGREGAKLEAHCLEVAQRHGIRIVGPNCIGSLDTHLPIDTTFLAPPMPARGHIGFISHSGAFCAAIIDWARNTGFGFSRLISLGNQADVNETDMLPVVAEDEHTRAIVLYLEGIANGKRFIKVAHQVSALKPVIALKVGRFEAGQRAAASHTGALAGSEIAYNAAFEKAGVFRADTAEEMFDWAQALAACPLPKGRRVAILTNAGGPGVIAADALEVHGLEIAEFSKTTRQSLKKSLPPAASPRNPVDMLASASPELYARCLKTLLSDRDVDAVLIILPPPPIYHTEEVADALIPLIKKSDKPILVALMGSELTREAARHFLRVDIPTYAFPEQAASAMGALAKRFEFLKTEKVRRVEKSKRTAMITSNLARKQAPEELVASFGIPVASMQLACSAAEAGTLAREIGFPLVMKVASADVLHKSDAGGVLTDLQSEEMATNGYAQIVESVQNALPEAQIDGVYLQKQVPPGQEVIVGMIRDAQFGPLLMFGSGGVEVEGLKDVAFALGPLTTFEAAGLLEKTWAGRRLNGFRNLPPADKAAAISVLMKLSRLAEAYTDLSEIEINPLRVFDRGAVAIDIRLNWSP